MILVVGATGELGSAVVRSLRSAGEPVTALVRPRTDPSAVAATGAVIKRGDLLDPESLQPACADVDVIVATANAIVPRRGERPDFGALGRGYEHLGRTARDSGVRRFVFASVPQEFMGRGAVEFDVKARVEEGLRSEGPPLTIARASLFMESWLTALGSRLPVRGADNATIDRGYWLARLVGATSQRTIDRFGIALVPGRARHAFIAVDDVADALAAAARRPGDLPDELHLGGPEVLSWREAADVYARVLDRRLRRLPMPGPLFHGLSLASRPFSSSSAHLLAVQRLVGSLDTSYSPDDSRSLLGRDPVTVEAFLRARAS